MALLGFWRGGDKVDKEVESRFSVYMGEHTVQSVGFGSAPQGLLVFQACSRLSVV